MHEKNAGISHGRVFQMERKGRGIKGGITETQPSQPIMKHHGNPQ